MTDWSIGNLSDIAIIEMGQSPSGDTCSSTKIGLPLLNGPTEFTERSPIPVQYTSDSRKQSKVGDILFCVRGSTTGKMNWSDQVYSIGRGIAAIRHKESPELNRFVKAVIDYNLPEILSSATGSTFPNVSRTDLENLEVEIPTYNEQKSIAEVLSSLDDKIDLLHRQNKTLEQMAETLFRQWFVEEAKEDWEVKKVGEVFETSGGGTPSTSEPEYWDGDICWTSPRDLSNNKNLYLNNTERKITQKGLSKISSGILPIGTVLMSSRAPIGYLAITDTPLAINQGYIACIPNQEVSGWYIHCWIKSNMDLIISSANGSTFLEIPKREFRLIDFVVPPKPKKREFDLQSEQLYNKIKLNEQQIKNLENSREILLPKLMNGTLKLSGI